jgi:hypothetical protein
VRKALGSCDRRKRRRGRDSGIVGGGATAEAFQVLIGRSMDALRVLVRRTTFDGVGELAQHLRDRTVAKGTTVDISAEVAKRGGPGPITRATSTPQRISAENPDRLTGNGRPCAIGSTSISALAVEYGAKSDAEQGVAANHEHELEAKASLRRAVGIEVPEAPKKSRGQRR